MACLIMLLMCPPVNHNTVEFQLFHFRIFKNHEMFLNPIRLRVWYFCPYQPCFNLVKTSFSSINVITRRFLSKCNQAKVLRRTVHAELIIFSNIKSREAPILRIEMTADFAILLNTEKCLGKSSEFSPFIKLRLNFFLMKLSPAKGWTWALEHFV